MTNLFDKNLPKTDTHPIIEGDVSDAQTPVKVEPTVEVRHDQYAPQSKAAKEMMRDVEVLRIADTVKLDDTAALYDLDELHTD